MIATITKEFRFEAAHQLLNHNGKCAEPHGHSYRVVVEITGPIQRPIADAGYSSEGMVVDFADVKAAWLELEPLLDHKDLNQTIGPDVGPTTAEHIAMWLFAKMSHLLPGVTAVTVWETATSSATVRAA